MIARYISGSLVSDQRLAADARLIEADANRQNATEIGVTVEEYDDRLLGWPARETGEVGGYRRPASSEPKLPFAEWQQTPVNAESVDDALYCAKLPLRAQCLSFTIIPPE